MVNIANIEEISCTLIRENLGVGEAEIITLFIEKLNNVINMDVINYIERNTRDQSENDLWFNMRKGRLTASKHHDIYTKVNTLAKSSSIIKPKTTPLVSQIIYKNNTLGKIPAIKWGKDHEETALKSFYAAEVGNT